MFLKKFFVTGSVMALGAAALGSFMGYDSVVTTLAAFRNEARSAWEGGKSEVQQAAEAQVRVDRLQDERTRVGERLAEYEVTLEEYHGKTERLEAEVERQEDFLSRARKLLGLPKDKDRFVIGGRTVSRTDLNDDAAARIERCKTLRAQLEQTREQAGQLERALREGQQALTQAQKQEESLASRLALLKTRIDHAQLRARIADMVGGLRVSAPLDESSLKLVETLDRLDHTLRVKERRFEQDATGVASTGLIDWEGKQASTSREACVSIDDYFDAKEDVDVANQDATAR